MLGSITNIYRVSVRTYLNVYILFIPLYLEMARSAAIYMFLTMF